MPANVVVNINRPKKWVTSLFKIDIYLDGQKLTSISNGQSISLEVIPGFHALHCQNGKNQSETIEWQALEGRPINLECEFIDSLSPHAYWGSAIAFLLCIGFWGLHWPYSREVFNVCAFLCFFVQSGGLMWSCWLHDKQWGKQRLRLFLAPEDQNSVQVIPSTAKQLHDHLLTFTLLPLIAVIGLTVFIDYYFNVILPAIFH